MCENMSIEWGGAYQIDLNVFVRLDGGVCGQSSRPGVRGVRLWFLEEGGGNKRFRHVELGVN